MDVTVVLEGRFSQTPDGGVWTNSVFSNRFWDRYLEVFENVHVVARVQQVASPPLGFKRSDGDRVSFVPIPYYVGPLQYLSKRVEVIRATRRASRNSDALVLRVGSQLAAIYLSQVSRERPFGLEVVGDPFDTFSPAASRHPLRRFFRRKFTEDLRNQCKRAAAVAYVTEGALQSRYPPSKGAFSTSYSSIDLAESDFREKTDFSDSYRLISVGTLEELYKGIDVLLDAVAVCHARKLPLTLEIVGDGRYRPVLERKARNLGIDRFVTFAGHVTPGDGVRTRLDLAGLFVLASRQEGLPRSLIEAMARGLPCIATQVGGIPELLDHSDLVPPNDVNALATAIFEAVKSEERRRAMSSRNFLSAKRYLSGSLRIRRVSFYERLRDQTANWRRSIGDVDR